MSRKIRLKHIAEALNISTTTVFRALKDSDGVSEKTKSLVFETARKLGYDFDAQPKDTERKPFASVAILCPFDIYFETVVNGMKAAIDECTRENGVHFEFQFIDVHDPVKQSEQLREIVNKQNFDCVAISPAHPLILNPLINELVDNGTTVITFNTDAPTSKRTKFIGQNAVIAGQTAAQIAGMKARKGPVAYFTSFSATTGIKGRTEGFVRFIGSCYPDVELIGPFEYHDNVDDAASLARQVLINTPDIELVFANNMVGTIGCARAVQATGSRGKVSVVGFDRNEEIKRFIADDIIVATVLQDPFHQGYLTIRTIVDLLDGAAQPNGAFELPYRACDLLMKANMALYDDRQ